MSNRRILAIVAALGVLGLAWAPTSGAQASYQRISGEGSSWSATAIDAMRVNVKQFGITVDYNPSGSSAGRKNFLNGTVDFAASDIPFQFQPEDGSVPENPDAGSYAYIPVTAGGTAFMYNLKIGGQRVTNLRLSGENIAKIFAAQIKTWNDPAIQADNPGLVLPARSVVPVVRSDGSGSTAQFTRWFSTQHPQIWQDYCNASGRAPACGYTSFYPTVQGMIAQSGDLGVAGYVSQSFAEGAIGYVNYSYALSAQFPVAKVLNAAGYYTEPTPQNVAVSLLKAKINDNASDPTVYLTQNLDDVYTDPDARNYQLSSYSYFILPTTVRGQFTTDKGRTLAAFTYYAMCQAQQQSASLGYSPIPINLVTASFDQIKKIPGAEVQNINVQQCDNPTFSPDGHNVLADTAPFPQDCDKQGTTQCATGSGGVKDVTTPTNDGGGADGGVASGASGGTGGASGGTGGTNGGTSATGGAGGTSGSDVALGATAAVCDPETGNGCSTNATATATGTGSSGGSSATGAARVAAALPTTLPGGSTWGASQTLTILVAMLTFGLVFAPAYVWNRLSQKEAR